MKLNTGAAVPLVFIQRCLDKLPKESTLTVTIVGQSDLRYGMRFGELFNSCSKSALAGISEASCHPKDFCWGLEASTFWSLKSPSKHKLGKSILHVKCSQYTMNTHATVAAKTIKNTDSNASSSSINAATKLLGFSHNCFKMA